MTDRRLYATAAEKKDAGDKAFSVQERRSVELD